MSRCLTLFLAFLLLAGLLGCNSPDTRGHYDPDVTGCGGSAPANSTTTTVSTLTAKSTRVEFGKPIEVLLHIDASGNHGKRLAEAVETNGFLMVMIRSMDGSIFYWGQLDRSPIKVSSKVGQVVFLLVLDPEVCRMEPASSNPASEPARPQATKKTALPTGRYAVGATCFLDMPKLDEVRPQIAQDETRNSVGVGLGTAEVEIIRAEPAGKSSVHGSTSPN